MQIGGLMPMGVREWSRRLTDPTPKITDFGKETMTKSVKVSQYERMCWCRLVSYWQGRDARETCRIER